MKKILGLILIALSMLFIGCASEQDFGEITFGTSMINSYVLTVSDAQMDSICHVDELSDFRNWIGTEFKDFETNTVYLKRLYVKRYSDSGEIIYILLGNNEPYKITRRITE